MSEYTLAESTNRAHRQPEPATQLWRHARENLRRDTDPQTFAMWIEPIRAMRYAEGILTVGVPSTFMVDWLHRNLAPKIVRTVQAVAPTCRDVAINFEPEPAERDGLVQPLPMVLDEPEPPPAEPSRPLPAHRQRLLSTLVAKNTFENFVVGQSNKFASAACRAVAESPGCNYNPLFLYGGVGLGKTHLMQAIGHEVARREACATILYMTSEAFTNELITAIKNRSTEAFRARCRSVDLLLIDDIQFIAGRDSTQEEFFHTFNTLHSARKHVVLTSDHPPKDIKGLEERLVSRFQWGLVTDVQPPEIDTRAAILQAKAEQDNLEVPQDVVYFIAQSITTNIRELEGALLRVTAYASLMNRPVNLELAQEALKDFLPTWQAKPLSIDRIQREVAAHFDVRIADLKGSRRSRQIAFPRQIGMYLARELTSASLEDVGDAFGGRDHTTVMHGCRKIAEERERDPSLQHTIEMLIQQLQDDSGTARG